MSAHYLLDEDREEPRRPWDENLYLKDGVWSRGEFGLSLKRHLLEDDGRQVDPEREAWEGPALVLRGGGKFVRFYLNEQGSDGGAQSVELRQRIAAHGCKETQKDMPDMDDVEAMPAEILAVSDEEEVSAAVTPETMRRSRRGLLRIGDFDARELEYQSRPDEGRNELLEGLG